MWFRFMYYIAERTLRIHLHTFDWGCAAGNKKGHLNTIMTYILTTIKIYDTATRMDTD